MTTCLGRIASIALALASLVASAGLFGPAATASAAVPLGGGAVIGVGDGYCTLTTIGHDNTGALVGFTAAHCGGLGAQVRAAVRGGALGSVVGANGHLDYAVIKFDPAKVAAIANFAGFAINGIGPDPGINQPACWFGAFTGNVCTYFVGLPLPVPRRSLWQSVQPGDDGGPVTSNDLLIGMILEGYDHLGGQVEDAPWPATRVLLFSAILADLDATGGPGAGFTPVPA
jgi:hypothetical protein